MANATITLAPEVGNAIMGLIDYVQPDDIPMVLGFLDLIQTRMVQTLSVYPEAGPPFQDKVRSWTIESYMFLYEYHPDTQDVHVLDLKIPGQDWR